MNQTSAIADKDIMKIHYAMLFSGVVLLAFGFLNFSWLESLMECYAMDGNCQAADILKPMPICLMGFGALAVFFGVRGGKRGGGKRNNLEVFIECSIFIVLVLYLVSSQVRYFNNDEYEHLHNAWLMTEGTLPYFALNMKHSPLLEWVTILFMKVTGEHTIIVQVMRCFQFLLSCGSLYLVYKITERLFQSPRHGLVAIVLVVSNDVWIEKSPEIRPDNLMLFFALLSFWYLIEYYKESKISHWVLFGICAILSMLGKQNAAIFYLAVGLGVLYDLFFGSKKLSVKRVVPAMVLLVLFFSVNPFRDFLITNIQRHLIPNSIRFSPFAYLKDILSFNPAVFVLFTMQLFSPLRLSHKSYKAYLLLIPFTCFFFLVLMNRPFKQEMIVMVVFMSILGSNMVLEIIGKLDRKLSYVVAGIILLPVFHYMMTDGLFKTMTKDLNTTKAILRISQRDDLVFDSYGKPIFRHHPLEPHYLQYIPKRFNRLEELKNSNVKYLISDFYTPGLPKTTLNWIEKNFIRVKEDPFIYKRVDSPR